MAAKQGTPEDGQVIDSAIAKSDARVAVGDLSLLTLVNDYLTVDDSEAAERRLLDIHNITVHNGDFGQLFTRLIVDMTLYSQPVVKMAWWAKARYHRPGHRLLGFRSTTGFGATHYTHQHSVYGQLIVSADLGAGRATPEVSDFVQGGEYYYTFLIVKKGPFDLWHRHTNPVQFRQTVETLEWAKDRAGKQYDFNTIRRKDTLDGVNYEIDKKKAQSKLDAMTAKNETGDDDSWERERKRKHRHIAKFQEALESLRASGAYQNATKAQQAAMERDMKIDFDRYQNGNLQP